MIGIPGMKKTMLVALLMAINLSLALPAYVESADTKAVTAGSGKAALTGISSLLNGQEGETYDQYLTRYPSAARPSDVIVVPAEAFTSTTGMNVQVLENFQGSSGKSVKTEEQGTIRWEFEVKKEGFYNIGMTYYPVEGKSASIERGVLIDGQVPFSEAATMQFTRIWGNAKAKLEQDNQGNDLRPEQSEKPLWQEAVFQDGEGYHEEPFLFYFTKGKHTIALKSEREPMVIGNLKLFQVGEPPSYEQIKNLYQEKGYKQVKNELIQIQGEEAVYKSSPTLYPISDRSTPSVEPYNVAQIRINTIGGYNWRMPGQWIAWNITVPKTGLYKIGLKAKQNFLRGIYSTRKLTIDGQVPFKEMEKIQFFFKNDWQMDILGGDQPYLFYLTEGTHQLKLEVTLGEVASLIRKVESSVLQLNGMYRKVLMITGASPDGYRDYQLEKQIPDMVDTFRRESDNLNAVADGLEKITGHRSQQEAALRTMADQLADLADRPETVPKRLDSYNTNVGALGTWILTVREQPLQIDSLFVAAPSKELPKASASFLAKGLHELRSFIYSFLINYNDIGNVSHDKANKSITVWIGSGRDQAQVIKAMIDDTFTPRTGISVNLKLVQMNVLLPGTLSGQGPDVAMQVGSDIPVNYAMRNAVADVSRFPDYPQVAKRFRDSALVPYQYGGGVYALPETQTFNMLFYRKDVLDELRLSVPNTWQDLYNLLPVLDKNHMQFGMPRPVQLQAWQNPDPNSTMAMLLFQLGGQFYKDDGKMSDLDSEYGVKAFKQWTEFYTDYGLPKEFDFSNRFRTGEMPIGIADYTTYNQLTVFAPEIRGLWDFAPVPGIQQADGKIRRDVAGGGSGVVMMKQAKNKDASWEFMKWWTDEATQTKFGREMEGLMGAAARYPTANIAALEKLPWPVADYRNLSEQFKWVRGIPQVPGGYFTGRHLDNAFWKVVNGTGSSSNRFWKTIDTHAGPRESLEDYVQYMNDEIKLKRKEFNLPD